ncbi:MAG: Gfo/Idh/MocA family oxidoreductase [Cyclobacteriaceae bacterium]
MKSKTALNRRNFIRKTTLTGIGLGLVGSGIAMPEMMKNGKRVGIIGLDTSHSIAFTKVLNAKNQNEAYKGYKITAAYPHGSKDIESSTSRIPGYIEEVKKYGVKISGSIQEMLEEVDVVLLETNDGRLHLEQALEVMKSGKRLFIDKPIAASLSDAIAIFEASKQYDVPVFSASSLRYITGIEDLDRSTVVGADTFSPAKIEPTHPDLMWYGVHGVETLFAVMGTGCESVVRVNTPDTDIVVGTWKDGRVGTFRGTRSGNSGYGGIVHTESGQKVLGPYNGYEPLLKEIIVFFETGKVPVSPEETLEMFAFMEAADESKRKKGKKIALKKVMDKAR